MGEKIFFKTKDGQKLCGVWNYPKEKTSKVVILAHGITVTKEEDGMFSELTNLLSKNGYASLRFDFRGHGESDGKQEDMTLKGELLDLTAAVNEVTNKGCNDVGLLGASFGGGISILFVARNSKFVKCLCLWNPVLNYDHCFINPITPWLANQKERMKNDLATKGWTEIGSRKYKMGKTLFNEMRDIFPYEEIKKISIPVMIIHGDNDKYVPYLDSIDAFKFLHQPKEFVTVTNGNHGLDNTPEEKSLTFKKTLEFFRKYL